MLRRSRPQMPLGWMHVTSAGDPLLATLEARMPPGLTDEERAAVFEELLADDDLLDRAADTVSGPLLGQTPDVAAYVENRRGDFRRRLRWGWSRPFDLYLVTRYRVVELGQEFNATYRVASKLPEPLLEAMTRNLARACLVSDEVYALLEAGHRNGALARARTLHELDIVSLALALHPHLAERYLEHHHVERYQHAKAAHDAQVAQGLDPMPADELAALKATADALIARYGKTYMQPWGWGGRCSGQGHVVHAPVQGGDVGGREPRLQARLPHGPRQLARR